MLGFDFMLAVFVVVLSAGLVVLVIVVLGDFTGVVVDVLESGVLLSEDCEVVLLGIFVGVVALDGVFTLLLLCC